MASVGRVGIAEDPTQEGVQRDALLLDLAATGDAEAFDALLAPRLERLFRIAAAILRSEPDARDALQDACLRAWRALPTLRQRERFDAWVTQIVVNSCRSMLARRRRSRIREIRLDAQSGEGALVVLQASAPSSDPGETEVVQRAFEQLDPTMRSLLVLHYVEDRSLREISDLLGAPVGTLKWRLWRARRVLERALEAERR